MSSLNNDRLWHMGERIACSPVANLEAFRGAPCCASRHNPLGSAGFLDSFPVHRATFSSLLRSCDANAACDTSPSPSVATYNCACRSTHNARGRSNLLWSPSPSARHQMIRLYRNVAIDYTCKLKIRHAPPTSRIQGHKRPSPC
jgi:hypothetical protein